MSNGQWSGGKGSKPRPIEDQEQFENNWDRIFGSKEKRDAKDNSPVPLSEPKEQ